MEKEILFDVRNHIGFITLHRPAVLNVLSHGMIQEMNMQLRTWMDDDAIHAVLVRGAGDKAFCAGGDLRWLYDSFKAHSAWPEAYFVDEYALDYYIYRYPKPYIAVLDGIVMGGGMGIAQGACLRIVGDKTRFAMPETAIGLFPDVGASHFLSVAQTQLALYLGVTGRAIPAADALYCGLADVYLPPAALANLDPLLGAIKWGHDHRSDISNTILALGVTQLPDPPLLNVQSAIWSHFGNPSIGAIMESLGSETRAEYRDWARQTLTSMKKCSPLMMCVTRRQLLTGRRLEPADCFRMELGLVRQSFERGDFIEGIRARIIDKDNNPRWNPARPEDVSQAMIDMFFRDPWSGTRHPLADLGVPRSSGPHAGTPELKRKLDVIY